MVEKSKIKQKEVLGVLDDIGCGCGSCEDDLKHDHKHDHDHSHDIHVVADVPAIQNPLDEIG